MKNCGCLIDLLVVVLVIAKLAGWVSISWWLVFLPYIIVAGILTGILAVVGIIALIKYIVG